MRWPETFFLPWVLARPEYFPPITVTTKATTETWLVDHSASHTLVHFTSYLNSIDQQIE